MRVTSHCLRIMVVRATAVRGFSVQWNTADSLLVEFYKNKILINTRIKSQWKKKTSSKKVNLYISQEINLAKHKLPTWTCTCTWDCGSVVVWLLSYVWPFYNPMHCSPPGSSLHGILRQEYWSGLPFPSPGELPDPGIKTASPAW